MSSPVPEPWPQPLPSLCLTLVYGHLTCISPQAGIGIIEYCPQLNCQNFQFSLLAPPCGHSLTPVLPVSVGITVGIYGSSFRASFVLTVYFSQLAPSCGHSLTPVLPVSVGITVGIYGSSFRASFVLTAYFSQMAPSCGHSLALRAWPSVCFAPAYYWAVQPPPSRCNGP